eukprot:COSAG01_NODE_2596_length_7401_cov_12.151055_12_plen_140_part_00
MGRFQDENGRLTAAPGPARGWAAMAGWVARGVGGRWTLPAVVAPSIFRQEQTCPRQIPVKTAAQKDATAGAPEMHSPRRPLPVEGQLARWSPSLRKHLDRPVELLSVNSVHPAFAAHAAQHSAALACSTIPPASRMALQ